MKIIKQNKLWYYVRNYALIFFGKKGGYERKIAALKAKFSAEELKRLEERVDYYCKLNKPTPISGNTCIADLKKPKTPKVYYQGCKEHF